MIFSQLVATDCFSLPSRFGYIVMNTTSEETVLSMDSSIMGDEAISVKSVNPRGRVFKALMESEN